MWVSEKVLLLCGTLIGYGRQNRERRGEKRMMDLKLCNGTSLCSLWSQHLGAWGRRIVHPRLAWAAGKILLPSKKVLAPFIFVCKHLSGMIEMSVNVLFSVKDVAKLIFHRTRPSLWTSYSVLSLPEFWELLLMRGTGGASVSWSVQNILTLKKR